MFRATNRSPWFLFGFILLTVGCAGTPEFHVTMDGFLGNSRQAQLQPGTVIHVLDPKDSTNPLLDQKLKERLENRLLEEGFEPGPLAQAAWILSFRYAKAAGERLGVQYEPDYWGPYPPMRFGYAYPYYGSYGWGSYWGPGRYATYTYLVYQTFLDLRLFDAPSFRETGAENLLWVAHAWSRSDSPDLRAALGAMLSVIFDFFAQDTLTTVEREVEMDEPGVLSL